MTPGSTVDWDKVCNAYDDLIKQAQSFAPLGVVALSGLPASLRVWRRRRVMFGYHVS
jgi:hypothetical protein